VQIRHFLVRNFRGIASLECRPDHSFCCLIGPGDSGKSTILDAVEAVLSSRWFSFAEPDFFGCNTGNAISIEVTIGELSRALKSDERLGLYIRGWTPEGKLHDEPEDGDEPVLTVRLSVDATMEPVWELVCDRVEDTRTLSNRDRALFGLVRLAGEDARHLAWGQGSVLSRLSGDTDEAAARLAEAYHAARASAKLDEIETLADAAELAEGFAKGLGAYVEGVYMPGLELGRSGLSSGSIALHDSGVPLRLAGLGTRRLATLAIQKSGIAEGAIILIDEIEHGLEPHRIMGVIARLKAQQTQALLEHKPLGQVLMTTHSDIALAEAGGDCLRVVQTKRPSRQTVFLRPSAPDPIRALMRFNPRALFARRILVTEGYTEIGMLLGIREYMPARHENKPIEQLGVAIADGNGSQACEMALGLAGLGYLTAIFRDSDTTLTAENQAALLAAGIKTFEYGSGLNTEQAIFSAAPHDLVQEILSYTRAERGDDSVDMSLANKIPDLPLGVIKTHFAGWQLITSLTDTQLRHALAEEFHRKKWFKDQRLGRGLAPLVWKLASLNSSCPLAQTLASVEAWLYA
jgi:hypothetical protein